MTKSTYEILIKTPEPVALRSLEIADNFHHSTYAITNELIENRNIVRIIDAPSSATVRLEIDETRRKDSVTGWDIAKGIAFVGTIGLFPYWERRIAPARLINTNTHEKIAEVEFEYVFILEILATLNPATSPATVSYRKVELTRMLFEQAWRNGKVVTVPEVKPPSHPASGTEI